MKDINEIYSDPDDDGFRFTVENAFAVSRRLSLFSMIRKTILVNKGKIFEAALDALNNILRQDRESGKSKLPVDWSIEKCDRGLLMAISDKGITFLKQVRYFEEYGLNCCKLSHKKLLSRAE